MSSPCMVSGLICCWSAFDCQNIACLCKEKRECLCLVSEVCLDTQEPSLGLGLTTNPDNKECFKISLPCISIGIKSPEKCFAGARRLLCIKSAASFPFDERYVKEPVCAVYGLQCAPKCGCCGPAGTECPALDRPLSEYGSAPSKLEMVRGEVEMDMPMFRDEA